METDNRRWSMAAALLSAILFPILLISWAVTRPVDLAFYKRWNIDQPVRTLPDDGRITLHRDQRVVVGRSALVLRGVANGKILLDHYLLDSNPHYAYPYRLSVSKAEDGFQIGHRRFRLISTEAGQIRIEPITG